MRLLRLVSSKSFARALVLEIVFLVGGSIRSADEAAIRGSGPDVAELIRRLGAQEFKVRENASAELRKYGETASKLLREAARENPDLEVRRRAKGVLNLIERDRRDAS